MTFAGNRAFLLTPPGGAAVAVIRLSGNGVESFLSRHFSKTARPHRAVHGELSDGTNVLDDPVIVVSAAGTVADINLHGGPWVVRSVLELARREGFEAPENGAFLPPAAPCHLEPDGLVEEGPPPCAPPGYRQREIGELGAIAQSRGPYRAPLFRAPLLVEAVDTDDGLEREMLTHLPLARTELGVRSLLAQPRAWEHLIPSADEIDRMLADRSLWWLLHPPRVAIVGPANVGKSTLANQLFAQERSITADVPGTTRDWVGDIADIDGLPVMLLDTPGIRRTNDQIELTAMDRAGEQIASADLVVLVLDASATDQEERASFVARYPGSIRVFNKCDRANPQALSEPMLDGAIRTVAISGTGIDELRLAIQVFFGCQSLDISKPRFWTQRQTDWLQKEREGAEQ